MYKAILTIIAIVISIIVFILYSYIALRLIPKNPSKRGEARLDSYGYNINCPFRVAINYTTLGF